MNKIVQWYIYSTYPNMMTHVNEVSYERRYTVGKVLVDFAVTDETISKLYVT